MRQINNIVPLKLAEITDSLIQMAKAYWLQKNLLNGSREYSYDDERCVRFSATYRFGNDNLKGKRERAGIEEMQRVN